ncbi:helix-hairpin-helix domain-containing protein [Tropicimonas sp. TH_r6]|uniref:helix-hairpin-helix domain-containing protein n=1 Tax=Tropicimonas sp. TH_r6 TaxID=3082085 RepID=UPI002955CC96|nr:helix-hairpin-helix domain-containing protein [Tropicimonas sp. TH_r6]
MNFLRGADQGENLDDPHRQAIPSKMSHRHLHLLPGTSTFLETQGFFFLEDLERALSSASLTLEVKEDVLAHLQRLVSCVHGAGVDWIEYYEGCEDGVQELFFVCPEFNGVDSENPLFAVNRKSFGNAGAMFEREGLTSFGKLLDALRVGISPLPAGLGAKKLAAFWTQLLSLAKEVRSDSSVLSRLGALHPLEEATHPNAVTSREESTVISVLSEQARRMTIGCLHLGPKTKKLVDNGLDTIEDLASTPQSVLLDIPGMGKATIKRIDGALNAIAESQNPDGSIDWEAYCEGMDIGLFPESPQEGSFSQLLSHLPAVLKGAFETCESEEDEIILASRIMAPPKERLSLEAVSDLFTEKVTRERVRQKEARILARLANALIHDDYAKAPYRFRPEFSEPWKAAAEFFLESDDEISFADFVNGLEKAWSVPRREFANALPLVTAIITGELASGKEFQSSVLFDTTPFKKGDFPIVELPLKLLQVHKSAAALEEQSIATVGEFLTAMKKGVLTASDNSHTRRVYENIRMLAECSTPDGLVDWWKYADLAEVAFLPIVDVNDPLSFLDNIIPTTVSLLHSRKISAHAADVFTQRTSVALLDRPTTEALASDLGGHGSTIKRIETDLLRFLSDVYIGQNLAVSTVHLSAGFLKHWAFIADCFGKADGDTSLASEMLATGWEVERDQISPYLPAIVAIVTGYPMGRLHRYTKLQPADDQTPKKVIQDDQTIRLDEDVEDVAPQRIILRGFRRSH